MRVLLQGILEAMVLRLLSHLKVAREVAVRGVPEQARLELTQTGVALMVVWEN